jgi:H+-translocating diphosphatase
VALGNEPFLKPMLEFLFESIAAEVISAMILEGTMAEHYTIEDPSAFILFSLVVHSFDLVVSSFGILSIRGTSESGLISTIEDPMVVMQEEYSVTIRVAILTFEVFNRWLLYTDVTPHVSKFHDYVNHMFMRP